MHHHYQQNRLRGPGNPIAQIAGLIVGVLTLVGSLILGSIVLAILVGLFLIFGIWVTVRMWWLRRQFEAAVKQEQVDDRVIDAEYVVIRERKQDQKDKQ